MSEIKIALVINTQQYPYHGSMAELLEKTVMPVRCADQGNAAVKVFDLGKGDPLHEVYYALSEYAPQALISLDCVGFELQTENDTLSYNLLPCRMAHILFQNMERYRAELKQQMNFSMFVYSMRDEDVAAIRGRYPNIPNISLMEKIEYRQTDDTSETENGKKLIVWWDQFRQEAGLES